jgi:hypothetical protein
VSEKVKRNPSSGQLDESGRGTGGVGPGESPSNALMVDQLKQAGSTTVLMPQGGNLTLPDVDKLPAVATELDGVARYQAWIEAVKALRAYQDDNNGDPFSFGRPDAVRERFGLQQAVQETFGAMSAQEQQIVFESEQRFASWKTEFEAQCTAEDEEKRRVSIYEYAGLDPDKRVDPATLQAAYERSRAAKARQGLHDDVTMLPDMIGGELQEAANAIYGAGHLPETGNEGWLDGAARSMWNLGVDGVHMLGHGAGSLTKTGGEMAGGLAVTVADPVGAAGRFVDDKESSRKKIARTLTDGSGGGLLTEAHAALLAYTPGVQDIGEGISNTSLESPAQTEAWKSRSGSERVTQTAGGIGEFSGMLAAGAGAATKLKNLSRPGAGSAPARSPVDARSGRSPLPDGAAVKRAGGAGVTPKKRAPGPEADGDFLGGKTSTEVAAQNAVDLGLESGAKPPGFNSVPEEWLPRYVEIDKNPVTGRETRRFNDGLSDVWGKSTGPADHAALAAERVVQELNGKIARGDLPKGKYHWREYGATKTDAITAIDRLKKIYQLQDAKVAKGNPTARARAQVFDALMRWAEVTP